MRLVVGCFAVDRFKVRVGVLGVSGVKGAGFVFRVRRSQVGPVL